MKLSWVLGAKVGGVLLRRRPWLEARVAGWDLRDLTMDPERLQMLNASSEERESRQA